VINHSAVQTGKAWLAVLPVAGLAILAPLLAGSQDQTKSNVEVKTVPAQYNNVVDGAQLFHNYCATCHGMAGKGNGPAALALKTPPADLTVLAKDNNGKFPDLKVQYILENGTALSAHGSKDMPIWGPIFRNMGPDYVGRLRKVNLTDYLKSIQEKQAEQHEPVR
jgi:mono/diheme cytochrome c family protein